MYGITTPLITIQKNKNWYFNLKKTVFNVLITIEKKKLVFQA